MAARQQARQDMSEDDEVTRMRLLTGFILEERTLKVTFGLGVGRQDMSEDAQEVWVRLSHSVTPIQSLK
jgi:hypothetical protein